MFIISRYALACKPYNDKRKEVTCENSSLRKWLNGDFYKDAFSKTEQNVIKSVTIKNKANPENGTSGGNDTKDKIFLPSIADMVNTGYGYTSEYSSENGDMMVNRRCAPTKYAIAKGVLTYTSHLTAEGDAVCYWWLRSPGIDNTCAAIVSSRGEINCDGSTVDYQLNGVRPVLKIKLK